VSKAFTKEDDLPDPGTPRRLPSALPPGAKNYITPEGARRLRAELGRLMDTERPQAAAAASRAATPATSGSSERLQAIDARIDQLRSSLESAVVVPPPRGDVDSVRFGATVSVRTGPGDALTRYRIVGVDEADAERGWISWVSPIASALLSAQVGDQVRLVLPAGERALTIVDVAYDSPEPID
jgi:transcription elongation factor GreB